MADASEAKDSKERKEKDKEEPRPAKAGGGLSAKLVPVLAGVNTALVAGVLAVLLLRPPVAKVAEAKEEKADDHAAADHGKGKGKGKETKEVLPGPTMRIGDFVVHLRDIDADRFARMSFDVEVQDEKAKEGVTARIPQIRDAFLSYLSDRTSADFRGSESIARVKAALVQRLGELSPSSPVRALYLTELVIQ